MIFNIVHSPCIFVVEKMVDFVQMIRQLKQCNINSDPEHIEFSPIIIIWG